MVADVKFSYLLNSKIFNYSFMLMLILISACERASYKTVSQLRFEALHENVQRLVERANAILTPVVMSDPKQHLDDLLLAKQLYDAAVQVFAKNKIIKWQHTPLQKLRSDIAQFQPILAQYGVQLMQQSVHKTLEVRAQVEKVKTQPYSAKGMGTGEMVEYLSRQYNRDLIDCCLVDLSRIVDLLKLDASKYKTLIWHGVNINYELERVIREEQAGAELLQKLNAIL
tara:strand:- start:901 stop:1581 length:681 start_codon:yes stop_codon:yes gene_type:complete